MKKWVVLFSSVICFIACGGESAEQAKEPSTIVEDTIVNEDSLEVKVVEEITVKNEIRKTLIEGNSRLHKRLKGKPCPEILRMYTEDLNRVINGALNVNNLRQYSEIANFNDCKTKPYFKSRLDSLELLFNQAMGY